MVKAKSKLKIPQKSHVQAKGKRKRLATVSEKPPKGWATLGFDISESSVAGAAMAYDAITKQMKGPSFILHQFGKDDHYFNRLRRVAMAHELVMDLLVELNVFLEMGDIYIAQEEPFPAHSSFTSRGHSKSLKQDAEMSGAFLGGLVRWGYQNIFQIGNHEWRQLVAREITDAGIDKEVTIHHSKWRSEKLAREFHCKIEHSGKFRAQQWARHVFEPWSFQQTGVEIPEFPPMIRGKDGKKPRPEDSKALAFQCDDRYDALAMTAWMVNERGRLEGS